MEVLGIMKHCLAARTFMCNTERNLACVNQVRFVFILLIKSFKLKLFLWLLFTYFCETAYHRIAGRCYCCSVSRAVDTSKDMHFILEAGQIAGQAQQTSAVMYMALTLVHRSLLSG